MSTRVVLLGASNLSRSFPTAVSIAREQLATRLAIHAAMGFGRSYGRESGFISKKFSGIFFSRLWEAYESEKYSSTFAFVTDIGNDLAYEEPVSRIIEWVEACVERLTKSGAKVVLTNVPIDVLRGMSRARFECFRALFFPKCRLGWSVIQDRSEQLHERLNELAKTRKLPIFSLPNAWYGFDPIHPRARYFTAYWQALFRLVMDRDISQAARVRSLHSYLRVRTLSTPDVRWQHSSKRFARSHAMLDDGSSIVLY